MSEETKLLAVPGLKQVFENTDIGNLKKNFGQGLELSLRQSWMNQPEADFQTGKVQVLWDRKCLHILATFEDEDIVGLSTNGMMRSLCVSDIFQVFVDGKDGLEYQELHISPDNQCKLLQWSEDRFRRFNDGEIPLDEILIQHNGLCESSTWIEEENNQWTVYLALSAPFFKPDEQELRKGTRLRMVFCRFDTSPSSAQSVLSATCSFEGAPQFHQRQFWHDFELA